MEVVDLDVQIPRLNDGFPKEKEEEEDDEENKRPLHHVCEVEGKREIWIGSMEENLCSIQCIPHEQQGNGVDAHDGKQHPCLVGKPSPADDGDQHLEELETVDGQDAVQSTQFGVSPFPKFGRN